MLNNVSRVSDKLDFFRGIHYATLVCNDDTGWTNPAKNSATVIKDASKKITFECEPKGEWELWNHLRLIEVFVWLSSYYLIYIMNSACDVSLIVNFNDKKVNWKYQMEISQFFRHIPQQMFWPAMIHTDNWSRLILFYFCPWDFLSELQAHTVLTEHRLYQDTRCKGKGVRWRRG